ncbi:MAG: VOC family protein [Myxococcota bacterium]|nr:VOC family protein [Myxococcota bacterium]
MRLRQVCLVAETLEPTVTTLGTLLDAPVCYRDPGVGFFGLENALLPVGTDFLEVVAPVREDTAASRHLARRGAGGYMLIMHCEDGLAARECALGAGAKAVWQHDENGIHATHFHPRSVPGAILSIDSMEEPPGASGPGRRWDWAGPDWRSHLRDNGIRGLSGAVIEARDVGGVAQRWSEVLGLSPGDGASLSIPFDGSELAFEASSAGDPVFTEFAIDHAEPGAVLDRAAELGLARSGNGVEVAGVRLEVRAAGA